MANAEQNQSLALVLAGLSEAISKITVKKIPPPAIFSGVGKIEDFFIEFDRYANNMYPDDEQLYLAVLPSFLEGESKQMKVAFGNRKGVTYRKVKDRLLSDLEDKRGLAADLCAKIFALKREPGESLKCYLIKLEAEACSIANLPAAGAKAMIRSKLITSLPKVVVQKLQQIIQTV